VAEAARSAGESTPLGARVVVFVALAVAGCGDRHAGETDVTAPRFVERVVRPRQAASGAPPLLVMLHGIGADENDLLPIASSLDARLLVVSLRAPRHYHGGWAWFDIAWGADGSVRPDVEQARAALGDVVRWLAAAPARLGADERRVFLLGFSQGAMMSLGVLQTTPDRLAGVVALSGRPVDGLVTGPAAPDAIARVPLFVGHGTRDDVLPIANGRVVRDTFAPLVRDFTYREYPVAHGIAPGELADVAAWLAALLDRPRG
jgi:phospholipase/carboxylesterase